MVALNCENIDRVREQSRDENEVCTCFKRGLHRRKRDLLYAKRGLLRLAYLFRMAKETYHTLENTYIQTQKRPVVCQKRPTMTGIPVSYGKRDLLHAREHIYTDRILLRREHILSLVER